MSLDLQAVHDMHFNNMQCKYEATNMPWRENVANADMQPNQLRHEARRAEKRTI
jgi:hypothetical protein